MAPPFQFTCLLLEQIEIEERQTYVQHVTTAAPIPHRRRVDDCWCRHDRRCHHRRCVDNGWFRQNDWIAQRVINHRWIRRCSRLDDCLGRCLRNDKPASRDCRRCNDQTFAEVPHHATSCVWWTQMTRHRTSSSIYKVWTFAYRRLAAELDRSEYLDLF